MRAFEVWEDGICRGCGSKAEIPRREYSAREPFYILECPDCGYEGCPGCMPLGRGSRCENCIDPETGE